MGFGKIVRGAAAISTGGLSEVALKAGGGIGGINDLFGRVVSRLSFCGCWSVRRSRSPTNGRRLAGHTEASG